MSAKVSASCLSQSREDTRIAWELHQEENRLFKSPADKRKEEEEDMRIALMLHQEENRLFKSPADKRKEEEEDMRIALIFYEEDKRSRIKMFVCDVCKDDHEVSGSYELECKHRFCQDCILNHFQSKTSENQIESIKCPTCSVLIPQEIVLGTMRDCKRQDLVKKLEEFATWNFITRCNSFMHCPNDNCNHYTEWDPHIVGFAYSCASCKHDYCLRCQVDPHNKNKFSMAHKGRTCSQQRRQLEKDATEKKKHNEWKVLNANAEIKFKEYVQEVGAKQCPNCKMVIEINGGCDHMTCTRCRCNFCYVCGKYDKQSPTSRGDCGQVCPTRGR